MHFIKLKWVYLLFGLIAICFQATTLNLLHGVPISVMVLQVNIVHLVTFYYDLLITSHSCGIWVSI